MELLIAHVVLWIRRALTSGVHPATCISLLGALVACGGGGSTCSPEQAPTSTLASPGTAVLTWTASPSPQVSGYLVYSGTGSGAYDQVRGAGLKACNALTYTYRGLRPGVVYYFAVTAVDAIGNESVYSNEASKRVP